MGSWCFKIGEFLKKLRGFIHVENFKTWLKIHAQVGKI
jgi:hypothetical protein